MAVRMTLNLGLGMPVLYSNGYIWDQARVQTALYGHLYVIPMFYESIGMDLSYKSARICHD